MRAHTTAEKAKAVGVALVNGTEAAAKAAGVSRRSVQRWVDDPKVAQLVAENNDAVRGHLYAGMQLALESVVVGLKDPAAPLQARATTFGILYDKWALFSGDSPTSRTEAKNTSDDLPANVKRELRRRYADLVRDPGDGVAAESTEGTATAID